MSEGSRRKMSDISRFGGIPSATGWYRRVKLSAVFCELSNSDDWIEVEVSAEDSGLKMCKGVACLCMPTSARTCRFDCAVFPNLNMTFAVLVVSLMELNYICWSGIRDS